MAVHAAPVIVQTATNLPPGLCPTASKCVLLCMDAIKIASDLSQNKSLLLKAMLRKTTTPYYTTMAKLGRPHRNEDCIKTKPAPAYSGYFYTRRTVLHYIHFTLYFNSRRGRIITLANPSDEPIFSNI